MAKEFKFEGKSFEKDNLIRLEKFLRDRYIDDRWMQSYLLNVFPIGINDLLDAYLREEGF